MTSLKDLLADPWVKLLGRKAEVDEAGLDLTGWEAERKPSRGFAAAHPSLLGKYGMMRTPLRLLSDLHHILPSDLVP